MAESAAQQVAQLLKQVNFRLVLAESCTGGKTSSLLTQVPGISEWFCGSAVTYREPTKVHWLNVSAKLLAEFSAESQAASDAMALGVLNVTPEANLACSITGHLGPGVDSVRDGQVYLSLAINQRTTREGKSTEESLADLSPVVIAREACKLETQTRAQRQIEAAEWMLTQIARRLMEFV